METIKRQIFVLRDTLKDVIDYNIGTDMVPIEYHVMDFAVPETAAAVVYVLKSNGELDKILADILDNMISFCPTKGFFTEGLNAIQIRVVDNNKALVSFTETVRAGKSMKFDDDAEAQQKTLIEQLLTKIGESDGNMKIERVERIAGDENEKAERNKAIAAERKEREKEIDVERQRINNLAKLQEGSTTGDAELADVRVGADGKTYENAGEAVRGQVTALKEDLSGLGNIEYNLIEGAFIDVYGEQHAEAGYCATDFVEIPFGVRLLTYTNDDNAGHAFYDYDKNFISHEKDYNKSGILTELTVPNYARYIRASVLAPRKDELVLKEGNVHRTNKSIKSELDTLEECVSDVFVGRTIECDRTAKGTAKIEDIPHNLCVPTLSDISKNGITLKKNRDGTYTLNGMSDVDTSFEIFRHIHPKWKNRICTLSGCPKGGSENTFYMIMSDSTVGSVRDKGEGATRTLEGTGVIISIFIQNKYNCNNLTFKPMLEDGDKPHTYVPNSGYSIVSKNKAGTIIDTFKVDSDLKMGELYTASGYTKIESPTEIKVTVPVIQRKKIELLRSRIYALEDKIDNPTGTAVNSSSRFLNATAPDYKRPIITFIDDDSKTEVYTRLYPLFEKKNKKFGCATITGLLGTQSFMTEAQVLEIAKSGVVELVSHAVDIKTNLEDVTLAEAEQQLANSKAWLAQKGFDTNVFVYPQGRSNKNIRDLVRKYYDCAFDTACYVNSGGYIDNYLIHRIMFAAYTEGNPSLPNISNKNSLEYYKACVDKAIDEKGWLVFCSHVASQSLTDDQIMEQLIDYIIQKGVEIVTPSKGFELRRNQVNVGDRDSKYMFIGDGNFETNMIQHIYRKDSDTSFDSYFPNSVTVQSFYRSSAEKGDMPTGYGWLETFRSWKEFYLSMQRWTSFPDGKTYTRFYDSAAKKWKTWSQPM